MGSVSRIDPETNEVAAKIPVGFVVNVAAGEGGVWALGWICPGGEFPAQDEALFRIDPGTEELVETIPLELASGDGRARISEHVAVGEGGVWITVASSPTTGEVLRIDPRTNEIAARIPVRGSPEGIAAGAGSVWVLSHPERTDEATGKGVGSSLLRIDPLANEVVATLARGLLAVSGGSMAAPHIAVGEDAVWALGGLRSLGELQSRGSPEGATQTPAFRVDPRTNEVAQEQLDVDRFHPFAVSEGGAWSLGSTGKSATLERLNPETLEVDRRVVAGGGFDAVFDAATRSFWLADGRSVVRVDLR